MFKQPTRAGSPRRPRRVHRRPGRPISTAGEDGMARRIQEAAVRYVIANGLENLSLQNLADKLNISRTLPLHHFGSRRGLLGAIAAYGFDELTVRLQRLRESLPSGPKAIGQLAMVYARFALGQPNLYRAMHADEFWHPAAITEAPKRAQDWIDAATGTREIAFDEFRKAIQGRSPDPQRNVAARVITALTDGFLFQTLEENVDANETTDNQLATLHSLIELALNGVAPRPRAQSD